MSVSRSGVKQEPTLDAEELVVVKREGECGVCGAKNASEDVFTHQLEECSLYEFLCGLAQVELSTKTGWQPLACAECARLAARVRSAECEYHRLKRSYLSLLAQNPHYIDAEKCPQPFEAPTEVKAEDGPDSEDEPLAFTRQKRTRQAPKKPRKVITDVSKKKTRTRSSKNVSKNEESKVEVEVELVKEEEDNREQEQNGVSNSNSDIKEELEGDHSDDHSMSPFPDNDSECEDKPKTTRKKRAKNKKQATKMYECDQCKARFSSAVRLEKHVSRHDAGPPYICEVCGAHYKHRRACDVHVAMHKGIGDWRCDQCDRLFPSKGALHRHNNIHTGKPNYQCDQCGKSFIHTSSFKMHKLTHSGLKPHVCSLCGLGLMTSSHLKRHLRIHSGEKRYTCAHCGKGFSERYNMAAHARSHEGAAVPVPPPRQGGAPALPRFRCPYCVERFERRLLLERHVALAHDRTLERPPPTPRNTMSKMLKRRAQAQDPTDPSAKNEIKSPTSVSSSPVPLKLVTAESSSSMNVSHAWQNFEFTRAPVFSQTHTH